MLDLAFLDRYAAHGRSLISRLLPDREGEWDNEVKRLRDLEKKLNEPLRVCFLGRAAIGKSTLINTLVAGNRPLLPAGGIGSLTAQALTVRHGSPSLEVLYHGPTVVNKIRLVLETACRRDRQAEAIQEEFKAELGIEAIRETNEKLANPDGKSKLVDEYLKRTSLMITGEKSSTDKPEYLIDGLRAILGNKLVFGSQLTPEDAERVEYLKNAVAKAKSNTGFRIVPTKDPDLVFNRRLFDHAAGYLAPMIREMRINWNSPLLDAGISLVDLPGVGVEGDAYKVATEQAINDARAIVLVVDRSGIDTESAELLRKSRFLNRLLHSADRPEEDPVVFLIAAVRIDDVAREERDHEEMLQGEARSYPEHFGEVQERIKVHIRSQLREQLTLAFNQGSEPLSETQNAVLARLERELIQQIHPVSAPEFRTVSRGRTTENTLTSEEQTGIPGLSRSLASLAEQVRQERQTRLQRLTCNFQDRVVSSLRLFEPINSQMNSLLARTRSELLDFLHKQQREYLTRRGSFGNFWTSEIKLRLEGEVNKARTRAAKRIRGYLGTLSTLRWNVLKAAVTRGGSFQGSHTIDLPVDMSLCFDGAIAEIWGNPLLLEMRNRNRAFGEVCKELLEECIAWVKEHDIEGLIDPYQRLLDALDAQVTELAQVGEDRTSEIRLTIRDNLVNAIERPIRESCYDFITRGQNSGEGLKDRILDLFAEMAEDVSNAAQQVAIRLMSQCVSEVREAVVNLWKDRDPLAQPIQLAEKLRVSAEPTPEQEHAQKIWHEVEAVLMQLQGELAPVGDAR